MPVLPNPRHEKFAQALANGTSASAAYVEAGYKANAGNACTLKSQQYISKRVVELQEEQLEIHQQATAAAAVNAQVTIESLIAEAEAARAKAMSEKGGAAAAVSALTAKAKPAGMWREKVDQHNTGAVYQRIERVIVDRADNGSECPNQLIARSRGERTHRQARRRRHQTIAKTPLRPRPANPRPIRHNRRSLCLPRCRRWRCDVSAPARSLSRRADRAQALNANCRVKECEM
jgi:hypothetical protein